MPRTTKRTMRRYSPLARKLIASANELDRQSKALRRLAEQVADKEADSTALQAYFTSGGKAQ